LPPMSLKSVKQLAVGGKPKARRLVEGGGENSGSIRAKGDISDLILMSFHDDRATSGDLPQAHRIIGVITARDDAGAVGAEGNRQDAGAMSLPNRPDIPRCSLPQVEFAIPSAADQLLAVGAEGNGGYFRGLLSQHAELRPRRHVPQGNRDVGGTGSKELTVRAEGKTARRLGTAAPDGAGLAPRRVPQASRSAI